MSELKVIKMEFTDFNEESLAELQKAVENLEDDIIISASFPKDENIVLSFE